MDKKKGKKILTCVCRNVLVSIVLIGQEVGFVTAKLGCVPRSAALLAWPVKPHGHMRKPPGHKPKARWHGAKRDLGLCPDGLDRPYLVGSLLVEYLHKLISRDMFHQIRSVLKLCNVNLPRWEALRRTRKKIRLMSQHSIVEEESVFGKPIFGLDAKELISNVHT